MIERMNYMFLAEVAQKVVDAIAELIESYPVNIMDKRGVILASGDKTIVGSLHKGAIDAIRLRRTVEVTKEQQWRYSGDKPGVNMPITVDGEIIGAVGISGDPEEVRGYANLVRVCVQQIISQTLQTRNFQAIKELRSSLIRQIIHHPGDMSEEKLCSELLSLGLDAFAPRRAVVIHVSSCTQNYDEIFDKIEKKLISIGLIISDEDLYGVSHKEYVIFHMLNDTTNETILKYLNRIYAEVCRMTDSEVCVSCGGTYLPNTVYSYCWSYHDASRLCSVYSNGCHSIDRVTAKVDLLISMIPIEETERLMKSIYDKIFEQNKNNDWIKETLDAYFESNMNIQKAAESIHIHKNTMFYRIRRIIELAELDNENHFYRDLLMYLIRKAC